MVSRDRVLAERFAQAGPRGHAFPLIVGAHDHEPYDEAAVPLRASARARPRCAISRARAQDSDEVPRTASGPARPACERSRMRPCGPCGS